MSGLLNENKLKRIADSLFKGRTAKRCIVIGSNPSLKIMELEKYVDGFDGDVIRINKLAHPDCIRNYGSRTDLLFACSWADEHSNQNFEPKIVIDEDVILDVSNDFKGKNRPNLTTGIICVLLALYKYEHVELIGFGMPRSTETGNYKSIWAVDTVQNMADPRFKHDINFEHELLWRLASSEFSNTLKIHEWDRGARRKLKCAFAMYARGSRYLAYLDNIKEELKAYVPEADIIMLDAQKAQACLPAIPERSGKWNWDKSIFMRLAIPNMDCFDAYDRVVWLDADVDIVSPKFAGILDVETSADGLAAVRDPGEAGLMKEFKESFPDVKKEVYCNSGVLVMDLYKIDRKAWRDKIYRGIMKHLKKGLVFPDQDILNAYFDIKAINCNYNTFSRENLAKRTPWLIHYVAGYGKKKLDEIVRRKQNIYLKRRVSSSGSEDPVDAVFVIGKGSHNGNEELRYALRNLEEHCRFVRDVYICGECPSWVDRSVVKHIPWPDRFTHAKDANIIDKLRHACEQPGIAKRILFCSDDQFQTRECTWDDFRPRHLRKYSRSDKWYDGMRRLWHTRLKKTLERETQRRSMRGMGGDVFYYQPHIWMPIDRDAFLDYAKWCDYEHRDDTIIASGYYNFANVRGIEDFDHVFLTSKNEGVPDKTHVAYNDESYRNAMSILKKLFPGRSRFEISPDAPSVRRAPDRPADDGYCAKIRDVMRKIEANPVWHSLSGEVSKAEEMRLSNTYGWKTVWDDIISRWETDTCFGEKSVTVTLPRSTQAASVLSMDASRSGIRSALHRRIGNGIM